MSSNAKNKRSGGKFTGNHTSMIPLASVVADIADGCPWVSKISPGFIKAGLSGARGNRRVKIVEKGAGFLLSIRDNTSHQEVHIYATDQDKAKQYLTKEIESEGVEVTMQS